MYIDGAHCIYLRGYINGAFIRLVLYSITLLCIELN